jgi:hypothetical protein
MHLPRPPRRFSGRRERPTISSNHSIWREDLKHKIHHELTRMPVVLGTCATLANLPSCVNPHYVTSQPAKQNPTLYSEKQLRDEVTQFLKPKPGARLDGLYLFESPDGSKQVDASLALKIEVEVATEYDWVKTQLETLMLEPSTFALSESPSTGLATSQTPPAEFVMPSPITSAADEDEYVDWTTTDYRCMAMAGPLLSEGGYRWRPRQDKLDDPAWIFLAANHIGELSCNRLASVVPCMPHFFRNDTIPNAGFSMERNEGIVRFNYKFIETLAQKESLNARSLVSMTLGVLAHEQGHYLDMRTNGALKRAFIEAHPAFASSNPAHEAELWADYVAGCIYGGANGVDASTFSRYLQGVQSAEGTNTHPPLIDRNDAINRGRMRCAPQQTSWGTTEK